MIEATAPAKPKRRAVRWLIRVALALGVVALAIWAAVLWQNYRSSASLADAIAETDRVDPTWRIADLEANRIAIADDQNAALAVLTLVKRLPAGGQLVGFEPGDTPPNVALSAAQRKPLDDGLTPVAEFRKPVRDLAEFSAGRFPITYSPDFIGTLTHSVEFGKARELLFADLLERIEAGDAGNAPPQLARAFRRRPGAR